MTFSIVMTACKSESEASKIADSILKKRLAACVKFSPVKSTYWWKGRLERSREVALTIVTVKKNSRKVMDQIRRVHSYETPEIVEVPVLKGDKKYLRWVCDVTE